MPKFHLTLKGTHTRGWGGASEEAVQQWYGGSGESRGDSDRRREALHGLCR